MHQHRITPRLLKPSPSFMLIFLSEYSLVLHKKPLSERRPDKNPPVLLTRICISGEGSNLSFLSVSGGTHIDVIWLTTFSASTSGKARSYGSIKAYIFTQENIRKNKIKMHIKLISRLVNCTRIPPIITYRYNYNLRLSLSQAKFSFVNKIL